MACGCDRCSKPAAHEKDADLARRGFLCSAAAGTVAVLAGGASMPVRPASAQSTLTPEEALKALTDGNERYVSGQLQSLNEDLSILKAKTAEKQEPFAAILSCADSRVPVEFVFDQSIGHLFVVRVAGNITTPEITASLEYGVAVLGTKVLTCSGMGVADQSRQPSKARLCLARSAPSTPPSDRRLTPPVATWTPPSTQMP
jgi:carbonic anhydrase